MQTKAKIKIILTGGGTAGHVLPHLPLLPYYKEASWTPIYIGSDGIEKILIEQEKISFRCIKAGKLRRQMSFQNLLDVFFVLIGILQSFFILLKERPQIVFTKGGYVSVPVAIAAYFLRIPVITHESDLTPGLANKLIAPFSQKILCAFPATLRFFKKEKAQCVGIPIRSDLKEGIAGEGYKISGFNPQDSKPILFIMGGSQGAARLNQCIENGFSELSQNYRVIHITGKGKKTKIVSENYFQKEFVTDELKHLLAISQLVLCRAGANSIFEMLALRKPMILIPLETASRGDQIHNAEEFVRKNWALALREKDLTPLNLLKKLKELEKESPSLFSSMTQFPYKDSAHSIFTILESVVLKMA